MNDRITSKNSDYTHSSIIRKQKWYILNDDYQEFLELYKSDNGAEYGIIELQNSISYIMFDLDLHFKEKTTIKKSNVDKIVRIIKSEINKFYNQDYNVYVLMRKNGYIKDNIYKNGIHIQIPELITEKNTICKIIRQNLLSNVNLIKEFHKMEIINPITDIIDESVYNKNGWLMYGSNKDEITHPYKVKYRVNEKDEINKYRDGDKFTGEDTNLVDFLAFRNKREISKINDLGDIKIKELESVENKIEREKIINENNKKLLLEKRKSQYNNVVDKDFIKELVDILNAERVESYDSWSKVGWCLKSIDEGLFDLFDKISKNSKKYDDSSVDKFWNNASQGNYTMGTLRYWAKQDNPEKYDEICDKFKKYDMSNRLPIHWDQDAVADDFSKRYDKFMFVNEKMYYYNGVYWDNDIQSRHLKSFIVRKYVDDLLDINNKQKKFKLSNTNDDNEIKTIETMSNIMEEFIYGLKKPDILKHVVDSLKLHLQVAKKLKLDTKPYLFCFENKIWDLTKGEFTKPNPLDYITLTTGYEYEEEGNLDEKLKVVDKFVKEILPTDEVRECALKILASGMCAKIIDKFTIFNGGGGNGKGVLDKLFIASIGNYGCFADNCILTEKKSDSGRPNPAKAKINKKRCLIYSEPDSRQLFNCSVIKELTGESELQGCRQLHNQQDEAVLHCTSIVECNKKPKMKEADKAITRRIVDLGFESTFTEEIDEVDEENRVFLMNKSLNTPEWRDEYKIALFHYLQPYFIKLYNDNFNFKLPECIKERNKKYLEDSNDLLLWFNSKLDDECEGYEYIEKSDDKNDFIKIADIYDMFKMSTYFTNINKKEKRELSKKVFISNILEIKDFKKVYKERIKIKNKGKDTTIRNILTNFKLVSKNYVCDDDEM